MKPVIAIIGRPNVGKSTLFNRLAGGNRAIVIDEPGATRDRNYAECTWNDRPFTLIDTGGFEPASEVEILVQMREQTKLAIEEADIILFLMDGRDGLTPADQEIARMLRMENKTVFYIVNKVDGPRHEALVAEFYRLGIDTLYPLSAQHGPGLDELMDDVAARLPTAEPVEDGEGERIRIAVIGRPNVGKSSLINRILGYERTIANPVPGTTRDSIDTPITRNGKTVPPDRHRRHPQEEPDQPHDGEVQHGPGIEGDRPGRYRAHPPRRQGGDQRAGRQDRRPRPGEGDRLHPRRE